MTKEEYEKKYGSTICETSKKKYSETGNYDWINREKEKGNDLSEYRKKLSKSISEGIMSSESAREARRKNLSKLNKTEEFRKKSSETAKKTSSRKDILKKRSNQLKEWRDNNPEEFYKKCTSVMINSWKSKPELELFNILNRMFSFLKRNQKLHRKGKFLSTSSNIRQIDIMSLENKIIVEFDGIVHFKDVYKNNSLNEIQKKDNELNSVMTLEGWTVIRVSYDEYSYRSGKGFNPDTISRICELIKAKSRGLFLFGDSYKAT